MTVEPMCEEEAPLDTIEIGKYQKPNQSHYNTNVSTKTEKNSRNSPEKNGRRCHGTKNPLSNFNCPKRRFTEVWSQSGEMSTKAATNSFEPTMGNLTSLEKIRLYTPTTGGTTTVIAERSGRTSPSSISTKSAQAFGTLMSLYDFSTSDQAFQALFGRKDYDYYCPLLEEEIDQEILSTMYKRIVAIVRNKLY